MKGPDGDGELFGERAGSSAPYSHFLALLADVLAAAQASATRPVAEHRVAHDPATDPGTVGVSAHRGHGAAPFVAQPDREVRVSLMEVRHLSGEELDVGAADPDAVHRDYGLAGRRDWH